MRIERIVLEVALDTLTASLRLAEYVAWTPKPGIVRPSQKADLPFAYTREERIRCAERLRKALHSGTVEIEEVGDCRVCNVCEEGYNRDYRKCHPPGRDLKNSPIRERR